MAEKGERDPQPGIGERATGAVKRAAGAVGRAVRGVLGQSEVRATLLYQTLHAEHEEVDRLFGEVLAGRDRQQVQDLWKQLALNLTVHARAEQETVYDELARIEQTTGLIREALKEHADVERQVAQIDAMEPGSNEFRAKVRELQQAVRHHVDEEENQLLPRAIEVVDELEERDMVARFEGRSEQIQPRVARELGVAQPPRRVSRTTDDQVRAEGRRSEQKRASGGKSKGGGKAQRAGGGGLEDRTVKELQELARKKGIEGRSKMKKQELIRALGKA
jgi:hemerythrin superfamily protein